MTTVLDGKKLRDKILAKLKNKLDKNTTKPTLAVILAGDNPASVMYVNNKKKFAEQVGINSIIIKYPQEISEKELTDKIQELNENKDVHAILVQLPLPEHIKKENIINAISPQKDVDGFTPYNFGKLLAGEKPYVYPCTPKGILLLLDEYGINLESKHVVVIGRSNIVGKSMAIMALMKNATVTICHSYTKNLSEITKTADVLISAVGKELINDTMVKPECVVVDVGIFKDMNGKTRGDIDFDTVSGLTSYISPVPGGVGPMTITALLLNTVELFDTVK